MFRCNPMFKLAWRVATLLFAVLSLSLALPPAARAATLAFNGGAVGQCQLSGATYSCNPNFLGAADSLAIASGYTVSVKGDLVLAYAQGLSMSGSARLETTGKNNIDLSASSALNVGGGTIAAGGNFMLGASAQSITANVIADTVTTGGAAATITGNVTAAGAINLGSSATITGNVTGAAIATGSATVIGGTLAVGGLANLGSNARVGGAVTAGSVKTGSPAQLNGGVAAATTVELGSGTTVNGAVTGTVVTTTSPVTLNGAVTAATAFTLASGSTVTGDVKAPTVTLDASGSTVKGAIAASSALDIGSGNTVNGNIGGGTLTVRASNVVVNGNATFTGDADIGSGATINGDLAARDVTTHASGDYISGNAAVNKLFLDWGASVGKVITCTGPGAVGCSCVTSADPNYKPVCGAAPPSQAHHIRISHGGSALTCQAEPVTLTACANAACSAPHFNGATTVTVQPGGGVFTISGGTNTAATVRQATAGTATLSASGAANASTCSNSGTGPACEMVFRDSGLAISAPDHVAMTHAGVAVQALKSDGAGRSCVPLVASQTVNVNFSCAYNNPAAGTAANVPLKLRDRANAAAQVVSVACGGATAAVPLAFDANGAAVADLQYAEVGTVSLKAALAAAGLGASGPDTVAFTAAPAKFTLAAARAAGAPAPPAGVFARASEPFTLTVTAVNADGATTTNFGKESGTAESFKLTLKVTAPEAGAGKLSAPTQPIKDGAATDSYTFDDVGAIELTAKINRQSGNYLDNPTAGFATTGVLAIGRFIPDHFDTLLPTLIDQVNGVPVPAHGELPKTQLEGVTMACAAAAPFAPCATGGRFVYARQPVAVVVKAYNGANPPALTKNYFSGANPQAPAKQDGAAKAVALSAWAGAGATAQQVPAALGGIYREGGGAGAAAIDFRAGVGVASAYFAFAASPTAPTAFSVRAVDADNVSSARAAGAVELGLTAVQGRMLVPPGHGAPTSALPVSVQAQYYGALGGYLPNPAYASDPRELTDYLTYNNCQNGLDVSANASHVCGAAARLAPLAPARLAFVNGQAPLRFLPPSPAPASAGSVDLNIESATTPGRPLIDWLPAVPGRQTFGVYPSGPVIYRREVY